jgi:oxygen-independent coproporphyrinogen-3 oxidase
VRPDLGLYVHWPYCARVCPYCDFNVVRDRGRVAEAEDLVQAILADMERQAARIGPRRLVSIFFGGGTPSLMDPAAVEAIVQSARRLWAESTDLEVTLEANPTDAEGDRFAAFAQVGVNRLSLGVQALEDGALSFLGRNHRAAEARRAAETAAAVFPRLSLDLIYALPGQSAAAWRDTLAEALSLGPEHLSPYQLTIEPGTAFHRAASRGRLAPAAPDRAADLYETTQSVLEAAGFEAYEVSNHARCAAARCRHNLIYWRGGDYLGVGPGAHGRVTLAGARWAEVRPERIADYIAGAPPQAERLEPREAALERLLMGLRTAEGVARSDLAPLSLSERRLADFPGLIHVNDERLFVTSAGRRVLDRLLAELAG